MQLAGRPRDRPSAVVCGSAFSGNRHRRGLVSFSAKAGCRAPCRWADAASLCENVHQCAASRFNRTMGTLVIGLYRWSECQGASGATDAIDTAEASRVPRPSRPGEPATMDAAEAQEASIPPKASPSIATLTGSTDLRVASFADLDGIPGLMHPTSSGNRSENRRKSRVLPLLLAYS